MRLFSILCFAVALYYGWNAVETMRSGVAYAMRGDTGKEHRRDDPQSSYTKYLAARWLMAGGFLLLGGVMRFYTGRIEKLEDDAKS